jgi:predicted CoA-substrate-specific enzyme activase
MRSVGIDVGSRTVKLAVLEDGVPVHLAKRDTSSDPMSVCDALLENISFDRLTVAGYGRFLLQSRRPEASVITEIKAAALGARFLHPECRTVVDIGGQDTKVIALQPDGRIAKFVMNDRCAAGTGRFLEMTATALAFSLEELDTAAANSIKSEKLLGLCSVFAESEVISLVATGAAKQDLARGILQFTAQRAASLAGQFSVEAPVLFTGGPAKGASLRRELEIALKIPVFVPKHPQLVAALGCAVFGTLETE